jgi:hypothetical protein
VVFSLTGGFKSLQGYMTTLGMLYADEIVYIFEDKNAGLIRIPRLPMNLSDLECLREHAARLALLEHHEVVPRAEVSDIPEALLECDEGGDCTFSTWGASVWAANRTEILGAAGLLEFPSLVYTDRFVKDFQGLRDKSARAKVQSALAKASVLFAGGRMDRLRSDGGIQYADLEGGDNVGHFRVDLSLRVTCESKGQTLRLRRVGGHEILRDP